MKRLTAPAAQHTSAPENSNSSFACANPGCTKQIERRPRGRQRRFCSDDCRVRAHRISLQDLPKLVLGYARATPEDLNAPAASPPKNGHSVTSKINELQTPPDRGSTIYRGGIQGPKSAVQAELIDARKWTEVTSSKGVKSFASRLTKSALRASSRQASKSS
jgi:hypothetical protein